MTSVPRAHSPLRERWKLVKAALRGHPVMYRMTVFGGDVTSEGAMLLMRNVFTTAIPNRICVRDGLVWPDDRDGEVS